MIYGLILLAATFGAAEAEMPRPQKNHGAGQLLADGHNSNSASNWSRFRGPNGSGIAEDKDVPVKWSEQDCVLWKTVIPGIGHSSPVVWGDRVFLQSASSDGKERMLLCVRVADGKLLWSQTVPGSTAQINNRNSLASSTPATDGERVYALFWTGQDFLVAAYDFQGKSVWQRNLGKFVGQHGAGQSPIVHDGKVFLNNDQDGSATLQALDARTGKTVWETPRKAFRACHSTPFVLDRTGGVSELIVASTAGISGYDPQTGKEKWWWTWAHGRMPLRTVASPIHAGGIIFANAGDGGGDRHTVAVKVGDKGDVSKTNLVWDTRQAFAAHVPSLLAFGEHLYWVNDMGVAYCCLARTGEVVWQQRLGGNVVASPILIDGKIYAVTDQGNVSVFPASPTFKLLGKSTIGEPVIATPAVADNRLFIRGKTQLYCISKPVTGTDKKDDAAKENVSKDTPALDCLPKFTAPDVPATGPGELPVEPTLDKLVKKTVTLKNLPGKGLAQHPMLYVGEHYNNMLLVKDGKVIWTYSTGKGYQYCDIWLLSNGNTLFSRMQYAAEVTPKKEIVWRIDAEKGTEIHTVQPIGLDKVFLIQNGAPPKLMIINKKTGTREMSHDLEAPVPGGFGPAHPQFRRARVTPQGTYLLAWRSLGKVVELDKDFKPIWSYDIPDPWAAIRLHNGNTLITSVKEELTREVNPKGETVWEFKLSDLPPEYKFKFQSCQSCVRLANGNTVFCSRGGDGEGSQLVEITPDKKVVWVLYDWKKLGPATAVQILDDPGIPEKPGDLQR